MKFDLIISNPPYNNWLDLKILKMIYPLGEKICFIHPSTWLNDNRNVSPVYKTIKSLLINDFQYYEIISMKEINKLFGIKQRQDIAITLVNKHCHSPLSFDDVDIHG